MAASKRPSRKASTAALAALEVTASNIRSLGPAGALDALPWPPYRVWLAVVDGAIKDLKRG